MCSCQQTLKPIKVTVTEFRSILNTATGETLVFSLELGNKMRKDLVWTRVWAWYGCFFGRIDTSRYEIYSAALRMSNIHIDLDFGIPYWTALICICTLGSPNTRVMSCPFSKLLLLCWRTLWSIFLDFNWL